MNTEQVNYDSARGLVDEEEMELMKEKIISYIEAGNVLERTCPGCGKELSKSKNLGNPSIYCHLSRVLQP